MEGAIEAEKKRFDLAIVTAWHTEAFARAKKLPKLADILGEVARKSKQSHANAIAFFHRMKAAGFPVEISRNEIN